MGVMRSFVVGLVCAFVVVVVSALAVSAAPSLTVVDAPDVIVASPPENFSEEQWDPEYTFSAKVRVENGEHSQRMVVWTPIVYADPDVEGCPRDEAEPTFPASAMNKQRTFEPGEVRVMGGEDTPGSQLGDAFWPMAVTQEFQDASTGERHTIGDDAYSFCFKLLIHKDQPGCEAPDWGEFCVADTDTFKPYVRFENQPPGITAFSIGDENPSPGQEVLLQGDAEDADTDPRADDLFFTWRVDGAEHTGKTVRHTFGQAGTYTVTLEVTDGFDTVQRTREVTVDGQGDDGGMEEAPGPGVAWLVAMLAAAVASTRRSRSR